MLALWDFPCKAPYLVVVSSPPESGEEAIAFQIKIKTLEEMGDVKNTVATPLQHLNLVVEALYSGFAHFFQTNRD